LRKCSIYRRDDRIPAAESPSIDRLSDPFNVWIGQADPSMITIEDVGAPMFDEIVANWV